MAALGRLPPAHGIAAMQWINVVVLNRWFLGVFMGTALLCVLLAIASVAWRVPGTSYLLVGSLLYVVGTFLVTMIFNVPRNDALAAVDPASAEAAALWSSYLTGWTAWNHVRTIAGIAAAALLTLALAAQARGTDPL